MIYRVLNLFKRFKYGWALLTLYKLRYKFNALHDGIKINKEAQISISNFRRNIHRLEKGLTFPSLKEVFATDYIHQTVLYLKYGIMENRFDLETIQWGYSVLRHYFSVVSSDDQIIEKAKALFSSIVEPEGKHNLIPYKSGDRQINDIEYDQLLGLARRRRSVRYFQDKIVNEDLIKKAYEIAKYSPSACNRQSFKFYFYNDFKTVDKISSVPGGVQGYTLPSVVIVTGNYNGYFDERDINAPIIDSSLTVMSFLFALETLGLSSVCINWPNLPDREQKIRKIVKLDKGEFVVMMIGIGYPTDEGLIPYSEKKSSDNMVLVNKKIIG